MTPEASTKPNKKSKTEKLVSFNLYKKVENWSGQEHRVFNFQPKYLQRIEELRFVEEVGLSDLEDFKLLKNISSLYFSGGIANPAFLEHLSELSFQHLQFIAIENWRWESLDVFGKFTSLSSIQLDSVASSLSLKSTSLSNLTLNLKAMPQSINLQDCSHIGKLAIRIEFRNSSLASDIYLPKRIDQLEIVGKSSFAEATNPLKRSLFAHETTFDLARIINPNINLTSLKLMSLILRCSNPGWIRPTVTELELSGQYADSFANIPRWFPHLEKLTVHDPDQANLTDCLRDVRSLKQLSIRLSERNSFSIEKLCSFNFPFVIEAERPGDDACVIEFFRNGSWKAVSIRE
jgi:hypothetical protein